MCVLGKHIGGDRANTLRAHVWVRACACEWRTERGLVNTSPN